MNDRQKLSLVGYSSASIILLGILLAILGYDVAAIVAFSSLYIVGAYCIWKGVKLMSEIADGLDELEQ